MACVLALNPPGLARLRAYFKFQVTNFRTEGNRKLRFHFPSSATRENLKCTGHLEELSAPWEKIFVCV